MLFLRTFLIFVLLYSVSGENREKRAAITLPVQPKQYTFVVAVFRDGEYNNVGTIVNKDTVITEAYHFYNCPTTDCGVTVRSNSVNALQGGTLRQAVKVITHENYVFPISHFDITLVKVYPPFLTEQWAKLPSPRRNWPGSTQAITFAWGGASTTALTQLKKQAVTIQEDIYCNQLGLSDWYPSEQICTISNTVSSTLCDGDYGAPLIVDDKIMAGLAVGLDCTDATRKADQYLDIVPLLPWIFYHMFDC